MADNFLSNSGLEYVGFVALILIAIHWSLSILSYIYRRLLATPLDVRKCGGDWALVTGATDGIGKAYAFALAKKGLNIILVSRTQAKLENVAADIESKFNGIRTRTIAVDFTSNHEEYIQKIEESIRGLMIGVLVNNVGMGYDHPEFFLNLKTKMINNLIKCNIVSMNEMTHLILPQMVERKKGAVINIASIGGAMCTPLLSVYSATKAYVERFTDGLEYEYRDSGVTIQCILPGYVVSNMSQIQTPSVMAPLPETFVASTLTRLGIDSRTTGYWGHDILLWSIGLMPTWMAKYFTFKELKELRDKSLKSNVKNS